MLDQFRTTRNAYSPNPFVNWIWGGMQARACVLLCGAVLCCAALGWLGCVALRCLCWTAVMCWAVYAMLRRALRCCASAARVSEGGGAQFQLEHHLFPFMPKYNFATVRPRLQAFARAHGVDYREVSRPALSSL